MPRRHAPENFPRCTGLPTVMRKKQPLVPRSNFGGKVCARTAPWFRGQALPVPRYGGGGTKLIRACLDLVVVNGVVAWARPTIHLAGGDFFGYGPL